jgi:hypothetical protein
LFILKFRLVVGTVVALILVAFTPIIDIDVSSSFEVNYNEPAPTYEALSPSLAEVKLMDRKNELLERTNRTTRQDGGLTKIFADLMAYKLD